MDPWGSEKANERPLIRVAWRGGPEAFTEIVQQEAVKCARDV